MPEHCVQRDESMDEIATWYYASAAAAGALARSNRIAPGTTPAPGTVIQLPRRLVGFDAVRERTTKRCVASTAVYTLREDLVWLRIDERIWPGGSRDLVPIEGKWIYVLCGHEIVVEVTAERRDLWTVDDAIRSRTSIVSNRRIALPRGRDYAFFLSPIELTDAARARLARNHPACSLRRIRHLWVDTAVALDDPFRWTLDVHHLGVRPALAAWQDYVFEDGRMTRRFVAETLQQLAAGGQVGDIRAALRDGEPARYLAQDDDEETLRRTPLEENAARLAALLEGEEHRIIEAAGMERGGADLEQVAMQWACTLGHVLQTRPGREFAARLVADDSRFPRRYVLTEDPPANAPAFPTIRYLTIAALSILKDLGPAVAEHMAMRQARDPLRQMLELIERIAGERPQLRATTVARQAYLGHRPLRYNLGLVGPHTRPRTLSKLARAPWIQPVRFVGPFSRCPALSEAYTRNAGPLAFGVRTVIETLNVYFALRALSEAESGAATAPAIGVVGAAADAAALTLELVEAVVREGSKHTVKQVAGALGVVSGLCDYVGFLASAAKASEALDHDQAAGHMVAAGGAAIIAIGWALVLVGATGGIGIFAVLAGAAIVAGGSTAALLATDTPFEQFAKLSFLGRYNHHPARRWEWSQHRMPAALDQEREALRDLLANFSVSAFDENGARVYPGAYQDGDILEAYLEERARGYDNAAWFEIDLGSGDIAPGPWLHPVRPTSRVVFDGHGRAQEVYLSCEPAVQLDRARIYGRRTIRARLRRANGTTLPACAPNGEPRWIEAVFEPDQPVGVKDRAQANTLDATRLADVRARPFMVPPPDATDLVEAACR